MSKKQIKNIDVEQDVVKPVKKKRKFIRVLIGVILCLLIIVLIFLGYRFINKKLDQNRSQKMAEEVSEIQNSKIDYVFIDINPSFVLTIKEDKVTNVACLNDDCISIYNDIDVKGKNINDSIDSLYTLSKDKGFDTSNGITVKTTRFFSVDNKEQVKVEIIDETTKDELLTNLKNNEDIKNNNNDVYYTTLWDKLKSDSDYGEVYTCNMDNKELECYFLEDATIPPKYYDKLAVEDFKNMLINTFNKFNVKYEVDDSINIYMKDIKFQYYEEWGHETTVGIVNTADNTTYTPNSSDKVDSINLNYVLIHELPNIGFNPNIEYLPLKDLNLLNPNSSYSKVNTYTPVNTPDLPDYR